MAQLIDSIHILCASKITFEQLQEAKQSLSSFVNNFEVLYGESNMVFNVHLLKHLADCVHSIGPLHTYSNYIFEDHIGHLVALQKGTTDVASQVCEKYLMEKNLLNHLSKSTNFRGFYEEISSKHRFSKCFKLAGHVMIRKLKQFSVLTIQDRSLIYDVLELSTYDDIHEYQAMLLNSKVYYDVRNNLKKKTYDSFLFNLESKKFAEIESIFVVNDNVYVLINEKFEVIQSDTWNCKSNICLKETEFPCKKVLIANLIGPKFALVKFEESITCTKFPNMCERN